MHIRQHHPRRRPIHAENRTITHASRAGLRQAFLRSHRSVNPQMVAGPIVGSVFYARYGKAEWAIATFSVPFTGTTDMPEVFRRTPGHGWVDRGDTGGDPFSAVPQAVSAVWGLQQQTF